MRIHNITFPVATVGDVPTDMPIEMPTVVCTDSADPDDATPGVGGQESSFGADGSGTGRPQPRPWSLKHFFCGADDDEEDEGASTCGPSMRIRKRRRSPPPPLPPPLPVGKEFTGRRQRS